MKKKSLIELNDKLRLVTGEGSWHTYGAGGCYKMALLSDGPHGLRKQEEGEKQNNVSVRATCFPAACAVAAGWNPINADKMARAIAKEAIAEGVAVVLGPGVNIKRSPTCGRNFEYYSEDPYLAGRLATAYIAAMQEEGVGTSLKHFAANNQESYRMTGDSRVDIRALREIYLTAFEMAVKGAQPASVMASYNRINGVYSCENKWLLTDVLRGEWGYDGLVMSDWGACARLPESIMAGMDLEMPDSVGNHLPKLRDSLITKEMPVENLNRAAGRVLNLADKYARDEKKTTADKKQVLFNDNHQVASDIAKDCAVLLRNNGMLPLTDAKTLTVIGAMAQNVRIQGGGSSHVNTDAALTVCEAFEKIGIKCSYCRGYSGENGLPNKEYEDEALKAAAECAAQGLPLIFCGGLTDFAEGEGYDRRSFGMPENQANLLKKICKINDKTVFVAFAGSPFDMAPADEAAAVLMMYLGGEGVGEAVADIITGAINPSGKLPETFPYRMEDVPCYSNFGADVRNPDYVESIFVGYRYYDTFSVDVRYPFGYGLSYTEFEYSDIRVDADDFAEGGEVSCKIKNVGSCAGSEVVQLYVKNPSGNIIRAARELRGFGKVFLEPGEEKTTVFNVPRRAFEIFDTVKNMYVLVPGQYEIQLASSLEDVRLSIPITVSGPACDIDQRNLKSYFPDTAQYVGDFNRDEFVRLLGYVPNESDEPNVGEFTVQNSLSQLSRHSMLGRIILFVAMKVGYSMFKGKRKDDPEVMMTIEGIREGTIDCVINQGGGVIPYKVAEAIVLAANGKKWQSFKKLISHSSGD